MNAHLLIHTGEKKHLCNFCGSNFLSKGQLKVHERSHTGEKVILQSVKIKVQA
jgi:KRAB domain-containing zinc finger protein